MLLDLRTAAVTRDLDVIVAVRMVTITQNFMVIIMNANEEIIWKPENEMSMITMYAIHLMNEMHNYDEDVDPINT